MKEATTTIKITIATAIILPTIVAMIFSFLSKLKAEESLWVWKKPLLVSIDVGFLRLIKTEILCVYIITQGLKNLKIIWWTKATSLCASPPNLLIRWTEYQPWSKHGFESYWMVLVHQIFVRSTIFVNWRIWSPATMDVTNLMNKYVTIYTVFHYIHEDNI